MNFENNESSQEVLVQFWEVCTHLTLHALQLYPDSVFEERIQYGLPTMQCRHPDVCAYIIKGL
jgi:hypothetical protein